MVAWIGRRREPDLLQLRRRMIRETNVFLTAALRGQVAAPRIPVRRADEGGYGFVLLHPGARALAAHLWNRLLGV